MDLVNLKMDNSEKTIYTICLGITLIMFVGFIINLLLPYYEISNKPFSDNILLITISIYNIIILLVHKIATENSSFTIKKICIFNKYDNVSILYSILLLILSILSPILMNKYNINISSIVFLLLFSLIPILLIIRRNKNINYLLIIYIISISILFHRSLISEYIWGWDSHHELFLINETISNKFWNVDLSYNCNAMLILTIFFPFISILLNVNPVILYKIVSPLLFGLVPVAMYFLAYNIIKKIYQYHYHLLAFLSIFFFISFYNFYAEMLQLVRQQIAELFFISILLFSYKYYKQYKLVLILFIWGLIVSHYGLSYIFIFLIILSISINKLIKFKINLIDNNILIFTIILSLSWYLYISHSSNINSLINISHHLLSFFSGNYMHNDTIDMITLNKLSISKYILKYMYICSYIFILYGLFTASIKHHKKKDNQLIAISIACFFLWFLAILLPIISKAFNITRIYHISIIILSPYFVIGFYDIIKNIFKIMHIKEKNVIYIIGLFLSMYLIFNSGLIYEFTSDDSTSISLNKIEGPYYTSQEVSGAEWIVCYNNSYNIYADEYRWLLISGKKYNMAYNLSKCNMIQDTTYYIFLGTSNINNNYLLIKDENGTIMHRSIPPINNIIYNNFYSKILYFYQL